MTHAVEVDGSIEHYFSTESAARDFAFEMIFGGHDAVVVVATAVEPTSVTSFATQKSFAEKMKGLFATVTSPNGKPYTHDDLVDALHQQGIPLASRLVDRLSSGVGGQPPERTVDAIARFFGVAPEALGGRSAETMPRLADQVVIESEGPHVVAGVYAKARNSDPAIPFNTRSKPFRSGKGYAVDIRVRDYNGTAANRYAEGVIVGFWESEKHARRVAEEVNSGRRFEPGHDLHSRAHNAIVVPAWNTSDFEAGVLPWETAAGSSEMVEAYNAAGVPLPQWLLEVLARLGAVTDDVAEASTLAVSESSEGVNDSSNAAVLEDRGHPDTRFVEEGLLGAIRGAVKVGETIFTLGTSRPNRIVSIGESGIRVATEKSERKEKEPQLVPAWMIETAWIYLQQHGNLTQRQLVDELNVKRSAFVCALLARLPNVEYESVPAVELRLVRGDDGAEAVGASESIDDKATRQQEISNQSEERGRSSGLGDVKLDGYADRLNRLFDAVHPEDRGPFRSEEVAAALQADGISLHASSISRLRECVGPPPSENVTQALAYFFNVDPDYLLSADTAGFEVVESLPTFQPMRQQPGLSDLGGDGASGEAPGSDTGGSEASLPDRGLNSLMLADVRVAKKIRLSTAEMLKLSAGLSQAAHSASRRPHTDLGLVRRFVSLIAEAAEFLKSSINNDVLVPVRYLEHVLVEWDQTEPADNGTEEAFRWLAELLNSHIDDS